MVSFKKWNECVLCSKSEYFFVSYAILITPLFISTDVWLPFFQRPTPFPLFANNLLFATQCTVFGFWHLLLIFFSALVLFFAYFHLNCLQHFLCICCVSLVAAVYVIIGQILVVYIPVFIYAYFSCKLFVSPYSQSVV